MSEEEYELMVKVILIGDSAVGKTNIMNKYLKGKFLENSRATVGVEFGTKLFNISEHKIKAQIWDTAGQEKYRSITSAYYKGSKGAFIVYDITRKNSFDNVEKWINDLKIIGDPKINIMLIGNKIDLEDQREVLREQGEEKAKSFGCAFLETSALNGDNIEKGFELMIYDIYKKYGQDNNEDDDEDITIEKAEDINLNIDNKPENKGCCS